MFSNGPGLDDDIPKLYCPDDLWTPDTPKNAELISRRDSFLRKIIKGNRRRKNRAAISNLLPSQTAAMNWLLAHPEYTVWMADKNLGPCLIERSRYLDFAHRDHLSDANTYKQLTEVEAKERLGYIETNIQGFLETFGHRISDNDEKYIANKLVQQNMENAAARMYLTAKVHKRPFKTRAIIATCGGILEGIAKWMNAILQNIIQHLPYVATSAASMVEELRNQKWDEDEMLFAMDAVSMYTNIHLGHAWPVIKSFLSESEMGKKIVRKEKINVHALGAALEIVMDNSVFQFRDSYWLQLSGTAMGTPPAPPYATIYFCIHELAIINKFPEIKYYRRYIDDSIGVWKPNPNNDEENNDDERWELFKQHVNSFGTHHPFFVDNPQYRPLQWTFKERSNSAIFLDLKVTLGDGRISTRIYKKEMNLYLYLPPHSCHAPGVLKSMIVGIVHRAKSLCTNDHDCAPFIQAMFDRLLARGQDREKILPMFVEAIKNVLSDSHSTMVSNAVQPFIQAMFDRLLTRGHDREKILPMFVEAIKNVLSDSHSTMVSNAVQSENKPLLLHLPFNPEDISPGTIQRAFKNTIIAPPGKEHISELDTMNNFIEGPVDFDRLQLCYHRQPRLKNILSPRKLRMGENFSIKEYLDTLNAN